MLNYLVVGPADTDMDGVPDRQDGCPLAFDPGSNDADGDGVGFLCDNCPYDRNAPQSDDDGDGIGDACDASDGLLFLFMPDRDRIAWQPESGYTSWNVYDGDLDVLKSTGVYTQVPGSNDSARRSCGGQMNWVAGPSAPPSGQTVFSLLTGVQNGIEGSMGRDSRGVERPIANPCP